MISISDLYRDLLETKYPNKIDDWERYIDPTNKEAALIKQYQDLFDKGQIEEAETLLNQNPILKRMIVGAQSMNQTRDAVIALERFYFDDVQKYLVEIVNFRGDFNLTSSYTKYDVVNYIYNEAIQSYMGIKTSIPVGTLPTNTGYFIPITLQGAKGESGTGLSYKGVYSINTEYHKDDCITYNNILWAASKDNIGEIPQAISDTWDTVIKIVPDSQFIALNALYISTDNNIDKYVVSLPELFVLESGSTLLLSFDKQNNGAVEVVLNGVNTVLLKKMVNGTFVNLRSGDIKKDADYLFKYDDNTLNHVGVLGNTNSISISIPTDGWDTDNPFTQIVYIDEILESDRHIINLILSSDVEISKREMIAWSCVTRIDAHDGMFVVTCFDNCPDVDLNIEILILKVDILSSNILN